MCYIVIEFNINTEQDMTKQERINFIIRNSFKYYNYGFALAMSYSWAAGTIVLGDDGRFWVCTRREASILMKSGYELAS